MKSARSGALDGTAFQRVFLGGHSVGSGLSIIEASVYHDVDGLIVTGWTHSVDPIETVMLFATRLHPAGVDPQLKEQGYDPGYVTTVPGTRYDAFHRPGKVDPKVITLDEATKDVYPVPESHGAVFFGLATPHSQDIDAPVLLLDGRDDVYFCSALRANCADSRALLDHEAPYYGGAPCVQAAVFPNVGHDINLHPTGGPELQETIRGWADELTAGRCPGLLRSSRHDPTPEVRDGEVSVVPRGFGERALGLAPSRRTGMISRPYSSLALRRQVSSVPFEGAPECSVVDGPALSAGVGQHPGELLLPPGGDATFRQSTDGNCGDHGFVQIGRASCRERV